MRPTSAFPDRAFPDDLIAVAVRWYIRLARTNMASTTVRCLPGMMNVIPGVVTLMVDVRGIDSASMDRLVEQITDQGRRVGATRGVTIRVDLLSRGTPTVFSKGMMNSLVQIVEAVDYTPILMPSGAGHDTQWPAHPADAAPEWRTDCCAITVALFLVSA